MGKHIYLIFILFANLFQVSNIIAQEYVVGGNSHYSPFSFIDTTGSPNGLDIDVLKTIAAKHNLEINFNLTSWDSALYYIQTGEIDIITGITFSEEREKSLDFTQPIHIECYSIFIHKNLLFENISSLNNYRPVVLDKDVSNVNSLIPIGLFKNAIIAKSIPEALSAIELGLADFIIAPNLLGLNEIEINNYKNIEIKGPPIVPYVYCMAVKKGNTQLLNILNEGISEISSNGELLKIQEKWSFYEKVGTKQKGITEIILLSTIITIILLILVFTWVRLLRAQIKIKTESLNLKNQELQKSEEKFRIITENSSDIIWHLDSNFLLTYISPSDERIRGYRKDEIIGNSLFSILKPEGIELLKEANKKRMVDQSHGIKTPPMIYELEEICKDGSWVWVEATATAFYDQDGNISGYHGVSRDITERKKAEKQLKEREKQLRELNSTKDKLFSIIAHDLMNPFNAILGFSDLLIKGRKNLDSSESQNYLEIINSSAKNTLILLDNLLNWAKSQSKRIVYKPEKINLASIASEIIEISSLSAKTKAISLNYLQTDDVEVYADVDMLKTILRNLISNAIKFTNPNGKIVIYAVQNLNNIEITVSDNGVGMTKETQNTLFKIDENVTSNGTAGEKGSGLGLILCKEFVEKHGGKIWVESEVGMGSSFKFSLPSE